ILNEVIDENPPTKPRSRQEGEQRTFKQAVNSSVDKIKFQKDGSQLFKRSTDKNASSKKLNLQGATALVPAISEGTDSDLVSFVAKCEFIFNNISDAIKPNILEAILVQLTGKTLPAVRYKKITTWDELKKIFKTVFGSAHSVSYLQVQLSQMRQNAEESIKDFSTRVKKTAHELTNALTCRTSEHKIATFRNPNNGLSPKTEFKREYSNKFCKYCRKTNHDISECRKLKHNEQNKTVVRNDQENHDRSISEIQSGSNVRIITPITQEHITCFSDKFVKNEIKFLIDSGSEMNIIKMSSLKGHIIVNEKDKKMIKGINASPVETVRSVVIPIYINKQLFTVKFDIVYDNFPILEAGIIV
ncbi:CCHC-type domain-containing protein, partial [Aphis craccivora]